MTIMNPASATNPNVRATVRHRVAGLSSGRAAKVSPSRDVKIVNQRAHSGVAGVRITADYKGEGRAFERIVNLLRDGAHGLLQNVCPATARTCSDVRQTCLMRTTCDTG